MQHRLATPVFQPRMYFFDADGKPLVGGKVYSFKVGTDEFKPTYRNSEFTAANQNPISLDQAGSALIYIRGSVQLKIYNKQGNLIEEKIVYQQQMQTQFFDNYGKALSNGKIWTYDYQSTIKKPSYANADDALLNPNPVVLDENGWGSLSIVGAYRLRVLDKNNVVVSDQDFKRPPAQVLTSRIYPLYFEEGITTDFAMFDSEQRIVMNESAISENLNTFFAVKGVIARDPVNTYELEVENIQLGFSIQSVTQKETLNNAKVSENLNMLFAVKSVTNKSVLVTNTMQVENINASFALISAQIKN